LADGNADSPATVANASDLSELADAISKLLAKKEELLRIQEEENASRESKLKELASTR
jgi:hypothetical protein